MVQMKWNSEKDILNISSVSRSDGKIIFFDDVIIKELN